MGGSVRIPASWCGLVGLKPSFGRIPLDFLPTQFDTIQHFGPLARTVADARLFVACTQGPDERDIMSLSPALDLVAARSTRRQRGCGSRSTSTSAATRSTRRSRPRRARRRQRSLTRAPTVEEVDLGWTRELADAWVAHWGVYLAAIFGDKLAGVPRADGPARRRAAWTPGSR